MRRAHRATGRGATGRIPGQGEWARGERQGSAKLTDQKVTEIRRLAEDGVTVKRLADMYGVSGTNIRLIVKRATWKHVA